MEPGTCGVALFHGRPIWILMALLCGFAITLMITSKRLHLYTPTRLTNISAEQRLSVQACLTSGLLLTGALYVLHADDSAHHRADDGRWSPWR